MRRAICSAVYKSLSSLQADLDCLYLMIADYSNDYHLSPGQANAIEAAALRQKRSVPAVVLESKKFYDEIEQELRKKK